MLTNYLPLNFRLADTRVLGNSRKSISLIVFWRMYLLSSGSMDRILKFRVWKEDLLSGHRRNRQLDAAYLLIWSQVWWRKKKSHAKMERPGQSCQPVFTQGIELCLKLGSIVLNDIQWSPTKDKYYWHFRREDPLLCGGCSVHCAVFSHISSFSFQP